MLRRIFVTFSTALVMIGVVVVILTNASDFGHRDTTELSPTVVAIAVAGVGVLTLVLPSVLVRPLVPTSAPEVAGSYRTRFFLRVAFAESAALIGFVGFIVTGRWWIYPLGAAFTAIGFFQVAPTAAHLARDQNDLVAAGTTVNLVAALRTEMPPPNNKRLR